MEVNLDSKKKKKKNLKNNCVFTIHYIEFSGLT